MLKIGIQIPRDKGTGTSVLIHREGEGSFQRVGLEVAFSQRPRAKPNQGVQNLGKVSGL